MTVGPFTEERHAVLLWVHTGAATVETSSETHTLRAGQAIWVPPGIEHCTRTHPGTVVFPLFLYHFDEMGGPSEVRVVEVPPGWNEWLIHQWDDNSHTSAAIPGMDALRELVALPPATASQPTRTAMSLPRSREALDVARALLRDPGSPRSIESYAALANISARTLQRQFQRETGMSFSEWRTRARVATAASLLAAGGRVGEVRQRVGFATRAGFTKAFKHHTGLSPRSYTRRHPDLSPQMTPGSAIAGPAITAYAATLVAGGHRPPPPIPRRSHWTLVNDFHVLMWAYRGRGLVRIGTREWRLVQGQAIWVPAGLSHTIEFDEGSLILSLARHYGRASIGVDDLIVFSFPPEAEPYLLHTLVADYSAFRPNPGPGAFADELFRAQLAASHCDKATGVLANIAYALRRNPADRRSLAGWAARFGTTPQHLGAEFVAQTGHAFPRWRAHLRMDVARTLLLLGDPPGAIARHLGYASPATFTKVFTAAHGMPPRDYRSREVHR